MTNIPNKDLPPQIHAVLGISGHGKTYYTCNQIDKNRNFIALDSRGQVSEFFKVSIVRSRQELYKIVTQTKFFVCYQPGFEDFSEEEDIDFFMTMCACMRQVQIVMDEIDYSLSAVKLNSMSSFRKLITSVRTQQIQLWITTFRCKETPVKLRSVAKMVCFKMTEKADLEYLRGTSGFNEEEIKSLPKYKYIILPKDIDHK